MKTAILGAGAMGSAIGALLHESGNAVTFIEVSGEIIDAVRSRGLIVQNKAGEQQVLQIPITSQPADIGAVDLLIVFVKCYHTEAAVRSALPVIGPETTVVSLQTGWGNGPRIATIVGAQRLVLGVCYHSATVLSPGHVLHAGKGKTFLGSYQNSDNPHLASVVDVFQKAGIAIEPTDRILREIWAKLALNVATLPTSSAARVTADRLMEAPEMQELMKNLLAEVVAVAQAQGIPLEFDERWETITSLLRKLPPNTKGSMLQDVEARRQTEIDVMCGAVIDAGARAQIPTPFNQALFSVIRSMEASFRSLNLPTPH
jgi:2-dehydropantoate 2-reductase